MKYTLLLCFGLFAGCNTTGIPGDPYARCYAAYSGDQSGWKTSQGCFIATVDGVQMFYGTPQQKYIVVGAVNPPELDHRRLAKCARAHRADGVIMLNVDTRESGAIVEHGLTFWNQYGAWSTPDKIKPNTVVNTTALIIKLQPPTIPSP